MGEAYLFSAAEAPGTSAAMEEVLRSVGAKPAWMDEAHWVGSPVPSALIPDDKPLFEWPDAPLLALFALQSLILKLESGAIDLALVGQTASGKSAALLLGGPAAVGRWNLPPRARIQAIFAEAAPAAVQSAVNLAGVTEILAELKSPGETATLSVHHGQAGLTFRLERI